VNGDGYADIQNVTAEIELAVKKEKKAEKLTAELNEQLASGSSIQDFATANQENVGEATQVKFANTYVSGIGLEPFVVGTAMYLPVDQVSEPLVGENGVFVISVTNRQEAPTADITGAQSRLKYALESRSNYEAYNALVEDANIQDFRLDIFYN